jgi:hypothetical protein
MPTERAAVFNFYLFGYATNQALEMNLGNLVVNEDSLLCTGVDYGSTENTAIHRQAQRSVRTTWFSGSSSI